MGCSMTSHTSLCRSQGGDPLALAPAGGVGRGPHVAQVTSVSGEMKCLAFCSRVHLKQLSRKVK